MKRHGIKIGFLSAGLLVCAAFAVLLWNRTLSKQEPYEIVLIQKAMDDTDFWTSVYQGGEMAAQEYNAVLTAVGPEREQDVESQNQMILDAVARKPDAIVLAPCSSDETLPYARQIEEAGITLVLLDSTMEEETGKAVVATDNYELGYKMGSYMKQFVEEDTVIGIVGHVQGSSTATGREEGFRAGLGGAGEASGEVSGHEYDSGAQRIFRRRRCPGSQGAGTVRQHPDGRHRQLCGTDPAPGGRRL